MRSSSSSSGIVEHVHSSGSSSLNVPNSNIAYGACNTTPSNNTGRMNIGVGYSNNPESESSHSRSHSHSRPPSPRGVSLINSFTDAPQEEAGECTQKPSEDTSLQGRHLRQQVQQQQTTNTSSEESFLSSCLKRLESLNPSLVLENNGSVARDHLAAERTFLAYIRTSLVCATMGVTLVQLLSLSSHSMPSRLQSMGQYIGAMIELIGIIITIIAVIRYFAMQRSLIEGKYKPAGVIIWALSFLMGSIMLIIFGILIGIAISQ